MSDLMNRMAMSECLHSLDLQGLALALGLGLGNVDAQDPVLQLGRNVVKVDIPWEGQGSLEVSIAALNNMEALVLLLTLALTLAGDGQGPVLLVNVNPAVLLYLSLSILLEVQRM